ncbi:IS701 family transposase [Streptomyces fenghuangensis]|uniref:IS701 family transposase n=1 Tax=Streptomyces chitinivorans TaxID=1257027 RepID=A0ABW7HTX8_9ACTN|nr:transposase [Streptomyces chitinivorans]MDH2409790.1 transposase [Streptomyces chitinivorans]
MPTPRTAAPPSARSAPLAEYVRTVFGSLPRIDQRRRAEAYLQGLLSTPGRKTMKRLARQVSCGASTAQALQQFISSSPWDWCEPRAVLTRVAARRLPDHAWVGGTIVSEKRGDRSVGVHRRFVPSLGTTVNCQLGVGLFIASESEALPVDWRLVLDGAWRHDASLRRQARIPDGAGLGTVWEQVLEMADAADTLPCVERAPLVMDLTAVGDLARVTDSLACGRREFLVRVRSDQPVLGAVRPGAAPPLVSRPASTAEQLVGEDGTGPARLRSTTVHLPTVRGAVAGPGRRVCRLFARSSPEGREAPQYWIGALRRWDTGHVLSLMRRQQMVESTFRVLEEEFGLTDFGGRSFPGWHHHMTMVSAAYAYSRLSSRPAEGRMSA